MSGILFDEIVFGPVRSRRLGVSLGINLLPTDFKYCSFNCIYCECGWTKHKLDEKVSFYSCKEIYNALEKRLKELKERNINPDSFTFAGNGEPTLHPNFHAIIDDTIFLRDKYFPNAKISVLSNSSMLHKPFVFDALTKIENNIMKLDCGSNELFQIINHPLGNLTLEQVVENLTHFEGNLIIQSLFVKGKYEGKAVDNTTEKEISPWLEHIKRINPKYVMIYSFERSTPTDTLDVVAKDELDRISLLVNKLGIETKVY
ncbi:MAG: radical SAM protein [Bacteroidetes bacterium]|nr:radical SAM protein [Bacteroidota bacterium]